MAKHESNYSILRLKSKHSRNAIQRYHMQATSDSIYNELQEQHSILGQSKSLKNTVKQIMDVAKILAKVLILGESGTSKELVAWAIHHNSECNG